MKNNMLVYSAFARQVAERPDQIALKDSMGTISYAQLNELICNISKTVAHLSSLSSNEVLVLLPPGRQQVAAMYGIFHASKIYQPIDNALPEERLNQRILESGAKIIIGSRAEIGILLKSIGEEAKAQLSYAILFDNEISMNTIKGDELNLFQSENLELPDPNKGDQSADAYIFYTSGSTGSGKAFVGNQKGLTHFIHWQHQEFEVDEQYRVAQLSQLTFDASFRDILLPLSVGGTVVIPERELKQNPFKLLQWLIAERINIIHTVPSFYRILLAEAEQNPDLVKDTLKSLKYIFLAGEPLYWSDVSRWYRACGDNCEFVNLYGLSELTMIQLYHRVGDLEKYDQSKPIPVGKPIIHTAAAVISNGISCEIGEIGEIFVKTPFRTNGYYNNEESNALSLVQNPLVIDKTDLVFRTGDYGKFNENAELEIVGRVDDQVKVNGIRVNLNDIEACISSIREVKEIVVLNYRDENYQNSLLCYYTGEELSAKYINTKLDGILARSVFPSIFHYMEEFPLNLNGKVDKKLLPKPETLITQLEDYEPPSNDIEQFLEELYKEVLNLPKVSRNASFFRIGGTSLKAFQVISKIYQVHEVGLQLRDVFTYPSIAQLGEKIADGSQNNKETDIQILPEGLDFYEASYGQRRLWIVDQSEVESAKFNIAEAFRINGALDASAIHEAFNFLIDRHEVLRTSFLVHNAEVKQKVHPTDCVVADIEVIESGDDLATIKNIVNKEAMTPFDLAEPGLIRLKLIKQGELDWILCFTIHHIIADGWTVNLLLFELLKKYRAICDAEECELPALNVQYKDYTSWHNALLTDDHVETHKNFWSSRLKPGFGILSLPLDFPRSGNKSFKGGRMAVRVEKSDIAILLQQSTANDLTIFNVLTSAINILLSANSGQNKFMIGMPVACRDHHDLEHVAGFFVNLIPLLVELPDEHSFIAYATIQQASNLEVIDHKLYPFDKIVEDLDLAAGDEMFNVLVQKQEQHIDELESLMPGRLNIEVMESEFALSKYDLTFNITEEDRALELGIEYASDLFKPETIQEMINGLTKLLNILNQNSNISVGELRQQLTAQHQTVLDQLSGMTADLSEDF